MTSTPNAATWTAQRLAWISFIHHYCRTHKLWRLHVVDALDTELFRNATLGRHLKLKDAMEVLEGMVAEGGGEWADKEKTTIIVLWRKHEEWGNLIYDWIDATGQKGSVLTLYEIEHGDLTVGQEFHGIDETVLKKALGVLVKRGSAQVFGTGDEMGVKFF